MKSKKLLLGSLSAMALVATPIAAVVSCDNGKTAEAATKASIVKATADDFKITKDSKTYFVSKDDAAKAGSLVIGAETFTWDAALTASTTKLKNDADKSDVTVTVAKATAGDFGLKLASGENQYFDATGLKKELTTILGTESDVTAKLGITLKFEDDKKLAADSLTKLNKFLKSASLEAKNVTHDDAGIIKFTLEAVTTTGTGTGTNTGGNGQTSSTAVADDEVIKKVKDKLDAITFTAPTVAGIKAVTGGTNVVTDLNGIKALVLVAAGGTAATLTDGAVVFPTTTELNGVTLTVTAIGGVAANGTGPANVTISVAKGQGTTINATIIITVQ